MRKILIIDDEEDFCFFIKDTLEITGKYKVIVATDGKSGVRAAVEQKPNLILLDIIMPGIDGFETLKLLKNNEKVQSIQVVMLTARDDDEAKTQAAGLFGEGYLTKPISVEKLRAKIEEVLSRTIGK